MNLPTIVIGLIVALLFIAVLVKLIRDRASGKGSCGTDCGRCPEYSLCHIEKKQDGRQRDQ